MPKTIVDRKNPCYKCGACCKLICLQYDVLEVEATNAPRGWLEKHWRLIRVAQFQEGEFFLYDCDEYNHKNHQCQIQNFKPDVCRDYPGYDSQLNDNNYDDKLMVGCGYRRLFEK